MPDITWEVFPTLKDVKRIFHFTHSTRDISYTSEFVVEFIINGNPVWLGNFERGGYGHDSFVFKHLKENLVCVAARGVLYKVNVLDPTNYQIEASGFMRHFFYEDPQMLILVTYYSVAAYDWHKQLWAHTLSAGEIREIDMRDQKLKGTFVQNWGDEFIFSINILTGEMTKLE